MPAYEIYLRDTPYSSDEMPDVAYEQSNDVTYLTHPDHPVHKLVRYDNAVWYLDAVTFGTRTPTPANVTVDAVRNATPGGWHPIYHYYAVTAIDEISGQESLVSAVAQSDQTNDLSIDTNYNDVDWDAVTGAEYYNVYKYVNGTFGFVGTSDDTTFRDENIAPDYSITPPRPKNPFSAENNYPAAVTFFEQRLIFGRTYSKPSGVWGSRSSDFENMNVSRPLQANDAYTFNLVGRQRNIIQHLLPMKALIALTDTSAFSLSGPQGFISSTEVAIENEGYRGASKVRPVLLDENVAMFVPAKGTGLRTLGYQFERDGYKGADITVFAKHLFRGFTIVQMAWAEYPTATLWCVRSDGKLLALTWQSEQDVWGWSLCETDGLVESCCVVNENGIDTLYISVARTVGEETKRFVERLTTPVWSTLDEACYLDSARRYSGPPADEFLGMDHLEGRSVMAVADGSVLGPFTVTNGRVVLDDEYSNVVIGLSYEAWGWTLPIIQNMQGAGSTQFRQQSASKVFFNVLKSRGFEVSSALQFASNPPETSTEVAGREDRFFEIITRNEEALDEADFLRSGDLGAGLPPSDWGAKGGIVFRQRLPLPLKIIGISIEGQIGG